MKILLTTLMTKRYLNRIEKLGRQEEVLLTELTPLQTKYEKQVMKARQEMKVVQERYNKQYGLT